jgi:transcriptional regulator with XRE-family HTH domain
MGQNKPLKYIPKRLGVKLRRIREALGLTQEAMLKYLDLPPVVSQSTLSAYERNAKLPPYYVLARYGDVANVWIDVLVRDSLDLPVKLPADQKSGGNKATHLDEPAAKRASTRKQKTKSRSNQH